LKKQKRCKPNGYVTYPTKKQNFPNLEKELPIQVQEATKTPNRLDQNKTSPWHIIFKTTTTENRERTLKAVREIKK
jgi:hypothetical protein